MTRILQFGATGQVAREMMVRASRVGVTLTALSRADVDLADASAVEAVIARSQADIIVNMAAYTAVDKAESEEARAYVINAAAPAAMARAAAVRGAALIHLSTDYVFSGDKAAPYAESDPTGPINAYGRTKLAGEQAVRASCTRHVVIRTAWVFSPYGSNFLTTMLRLGESREVIEVVDDQYGSPTAASDLADATLAIARSAAAGRARWGVYHFANDGVTSWCGFANAIFDIAAPRTGRRPEIRPITTAGYPTAARRPANSALDCLKITRQYGIRPRPWREALAETLEGLQGAQASAPAD